ncbi:MAG: DNA gyrase subunit A [Bacteroides sp.]|nr:DNA gyrase subunit A [Bacteroides sp.]MCM1094994.1 DNA gyrase subunit A [Terasakiella sp.]
MLEEDRILKINIEQEMKSAYIDYSMSVIVSRALPDVRDGMKPVHRRVLFGMDRMGNTSDKPHKKSANCVGYVMGKYHPHGDSSIYGTVVRMAQDWSLRYCLVDGHGNFGSVDGDGPAAMRYTEVRLAKMGEELLRDLDFDTVDFQPNYDNSLEEPVVLPARYPNLLVNGASGIAVGMATNMPPHNLTESINASIAVLENPDITVDELIKIIPAPDFPTGGTIYNYGGVKEAYTTGRGRVVIRARATIEQEANHETIVVNEIPYGVNKAELIKNIAELVTEKRLDGIADINDESDADGMRIVIKLRSDANSSVVLNKLYKMTQMQSSFAVNNVALVNGRPKLLSLKELLSAFVEHRHEVVIRRTQYKLGKARERAHILEGLIIACDNIDEVISIIRSTPRDEDPRERLKERFGLTDPQAQAVVDMQLKRLSGLEQDKLHQQYKEVEEEIAGYELILSDPVVCRNLIRTELEEIRDTYGDTRKTDIDYTAGDFNAEDFYADDDMIITISHLGYIKRTPLSEYRAQHRGGVGSRASQTRDEDFIEHIYTASMHSSMLFFTDRGLVYKLKVYELPEGTRASKGRALQNVLSIEPGDKVRAYIACKSLADAEYCGSHYLIFATRRGVVKKTSLAEYARVMAKGKKAIVIREGDSLIGVSMATDADDILLAARRGKAIRFSAGSLRAMGRVSTGVRGMRLFGDNEVVGMITMEPETANTVLVVSEKGYGKRTSQDAYPAKHRGGQGLKTINVTEKTGELIGFESVNDDDDLMIINRSGIAVRLRVADIRVAGRATQGVRLINLEKRADEIASVCVVPTDPEAEAEHIDGEELPELDLAQVDAEATEEPDDTADDDTAADNE